MKTLNELKIIRDEMVKLKKKGKCFNIANCAQSYAIYRELMYGKSNCTDKRLLRILPYLR